MLKLEGREWRIVGKFGVEVKQKQIPHPQTIHTQIHLTSTTSKPSLLGSFLYLIASLRESSSSSARVERFTTTV